MEKELLEREYTSLRDELLKWQERQITFSQITIGVIVAFTGYMIKDGRQSGLNWQLTSLFPVILCTITMHILRIFELFTYRIATFQTVFHKSIWEKEICHVPYCRDAIGYNKTMTIVYFLICFSTTALFYIIFPSQWDRLITAPLTVAYIFAFITGIRLFKLEASNDKRELLNGWEKRKKIIEANQKLPED